VGPPKYVVVTELSSWLRQRGGVRLMGMMLGGLVLLAACGQADAHAGSGSSAAGELHQAVQRTLASTSFVAQVEAAGSAGGVKIIYRAPDRFERINASGDVEMIGIGRTMFVGLAALASGGPPGVAGLPVVANPLAPGGAPAGPGTFQRIDGPTSGPSPVDGALVELRTLAGATQVERDGGTFHWRAGSGKAAVSGDAHTGGGRIADFTFLRADPALNSARETYRLTDYDAAPPVETPPADKVVDVPGMPPCLSDGSLPPGQTVCASDSATTATTTRPRPTPTVSGPSPLELRAVLSVDSGACPGLGGGQLPAGEVRLAGAAGCYHLGPTLVAIHRATAHQDQGPDGITIALDLSPADGTAVRSALSGQVGRQLAMVMFARVLSAPTVNDPSYTTDSIAITSLDPQTAANVIKSLAG